VSEEITYRITGPRFTEHITIGVANRVRHCGPKIIHMAGWDLETVVAYCKRHGWTIERLGDKTTP
jgi:hypothetical protein